MHPTNWQDLTVGDLEDGGEVDLKTGPFGTQLHASDYVESGTPVINVRNIGMGSIRSDKLAFIGEDTLKRLSSHILKEGDIVFGRKGAVERHAIIRKEQSEWFQGSDCLRLRLHSKRATARYLSYTFLTQAHMQWMVNQCSHGATMASLNQDIVRRIPIRLPPLPTQRKIAAILSAYDDLIENNARRIKILEEMAQAIYREWFVNFRFPGHEDVPMVDSELGPIPEGWEVKPVGEAIEFLGGGTPSRKVDEYWTSGNINWYAPSDLTASKTAFMDRSSDRITELGLKKSSARMFPPFSVMMTSRATLGVLSINTTPACTNQGFITCIPNAEVPLQVLFFWLRENEDQLSGLATGATFKEITKSVFKTVPIVMPVKPVVGAYVKLVEPIFEQMLVMQRQDVVLRLTRDLLLPRLVSGEFDVSNLDIDIGDDAE